MTTWVDDRPPVTASRTRAMAALFTSVALMNITMVGAGAAATLLARDLGGEGSSGLPNAATVIGTALGALFGGALMAEIGRRRALLTTFAVAATGTFIAFLGAAAGSLELIMLGMFLLGIGNGGAQLTRYLAAELFPASRKGTAVGAIVWSGTIGAIVGPALISPAAGVAGGHGLPSLSGPIAVSTVAAACAALATRILPRNLGTTQIRRKRSGSTIRQAFRRPAVRLSIVAMAAAHVAMVSMMLMTPVQVHQHGHGLGVIGMILSAHMIGMFALAPLSGKIADRFGGRVAIGGGVAVLVTSAVVAASTGTSDDLGMPIALFLLGYGWNLAFVGGSSTLSRELPEETRFQLQGVIDAIIWSSAAVASLCAGPLFGIGGYPLLAMIAGLVALVPISFLARR